VATSSECLLHLHYTTVVLKLFLHHRATSSVTSQFQTYTQISFNHLFNCNLSFALNASESVCWPSCNVNSYGFVTARCTDISFVISMTWPWSSATRGQSITTDVTRPLFNQSTEHVTVGHDKLTRLQLWNVIHTHSQRQQLITLETTATTSTSAEDNYTTLIPCSGISNADVSSYLTLGFPTMVLLIAIHMIWRMLH